MSPTLSHGKQLALRKRLLAYHFCQSHDLNTLSVAQFLAHLVQQLVDSELLVGYAEKVQDEDVSLKTMGEDPDVAFKRLVAFPLLEIDAPKHPCFLLIDSIDESCITGTPTSSTATSSKTCPSAISSTIGELLGTHCHLLPPWLVLICTARKHSKSISKLFSGFRKISLDDLRKSQVLGHSHFYCVIAHINDQLYIYLLVVCFSGRERRAAVHPLQTGPRLLFATTHSP